MKSHNLHTGKRSWKYDLPDDGEHIPNKEESKKLRQLMAKHNKSEKEIRSIPKFRKILAEAQRSSEKNESDDNKNKEKILKKIRSKTGLPNQHPLSKLELNKHIHPHRTITVDWMETLTKIKFSKYDKEYFEERNIEYQKYT